MAVLHPKNDAEFETLLKQNNSKPLVIDFTASWCGPCKMIAPEFEAFSVKYTQFIFIKVDVDECPQTASKYNVTAMPTFEVLSKGPDHEHMDKVVGASSEKLEAMIKKYMNN